ncbi:hypothetical protein N658DRAFT_489523 [Parathielavia hyrcaniae]|uniref:Uncharacterized protein n=1 Tax=Parathielavia hyrcaniae TaxID=113614 RepID=A0AAN6PSQ4_9PEZI|nr:hypothetical protein N658DRAFT_489523 [Parathielavia hyrcaniae]
MVGLYDDFAFDGSDFNAFLAQDQYLAGSSPEDLHGRSVTEPHFPPSIHALKGQPHHHHQPYPLSPTDPLGPHLENALRTAHLARSAPTSFPIPSANANANHHHPPHASDLTAIDTMGLAWDAHALTTNPPTTALTTTTSSNPAPSSSTILDDSNPNPHSHAAASYPTDLDLGSSSLATAAVQSSSSELLRQALRERDEARMQLSTARNELYAARQLGKRLRAERDEARSQADFLGAERVKLKQTEARLRRERNEARLAVALRKGGKVEGGGGGGSGGVRGGGGGDGRRAGPGLGGGGGFLGESQGEESGESPEVGVNMDLG